MNLKHYLSVFRVKAALKITLGGVICIIICNYFHLPSSYLSPVILFMIMTAYHGKTFEVGVQSLVGSVLSGIYSLLIVYYFLDSKPLYLILAAIWIFFCITFIGRYVIASVLSAILTAMSMFVAIFSTVSQTTSTVENYLIQLFIAVSVSWLVDEIIWPQRSREAFFLTLSTAYKDYSEQFGSYARGGGRPAGNQKFDSASLDIFTNLVNLVRRTEHETRGEDFPAEPLLMLVAYAKSVYIKLDLIDGFMCEDHPCLADEDVTGELRALYSALSEGFGDLAGAIDENRAAAVLDSGLDSKIAVLRERYENMHLAAGKDQDYFEDLLAFGSILPLLEDTVTLLRKAYRVWSIICNREYDKLAQERVTRAPEVEKDRAKRVFSISEESAHQSIKTIIVIMLLLLGELVFHLPGGFQASFYGVLFGSIPNTGQAHLRGRLAIIGVLLGLLYGITGLYIVALIPHFLILVLLFSLGFFISAYITSGDQKIAFSGLQAGLMIPYVFLADAGPQVNLDLAMMRFFALLMASAIGLFVLHNVWPVSPYNELKKKISKAIGISGAIFGKLLMLDEKEREEVESLVDPLAATLPTSASLLFDAQYIISDARLHAEDFIEIIESLEVIYAELETIKKTIYGGMDNELMKKYFEHMAPDYRAVCGLFDNASRQFQTGDDISLFLASLMSGIKDHRQEFRETGLWKEFPLEDLERDVLIATSVDGVLASLYKITVCIKKINESELPSGLGLRASKA
ncbi:MAG: FUSC family protein [Thermodesulfobacteriota bacterium]